MRPALLKLRPALEAETTVAREAAAVTAYDREALRAAIFHAARDGHSSWRIAAPGSVNLAATPAAMAATDWLTTEGLTWSWERRHCETGDGRKVEVCDLLISWSQGYGE